MTTPRGATTAAAETSDPGGPSPTTPLRIHADRAAGTVAIDWADGHHTGFFTFRLLRERCPCEECAARRSQSGHHHE